MTNLYKGDAKMLINTNIKRIVGGVRDKGSKIYGQCGLAEEERL